MKKLILKVSIVMMIVIISPVEAQEVVVKHNNHKVVKVKPNRPKVVVKNPNKIRKNHIWIKGHWKWSFRKHRYIWVKGHWKRKKRLEFGFRNTRKMFLEDLFG